MRRRQLPGSPVCAAFAQTGVEERLAPITTEGYEVQLARPAGSASVPRAWRGEYILPRQSSVMPERTLCDS
jgi:hypothetical protein